MLCEATIILQNLLAYCYSVQSEDMVCSQLCGDYINDINNSICLDVVYSTPNFKEVWEIFEKWCGK
jgi:hypothetical protein